MKELEAKTGKKVVTTLNVKTLLADTETKILKKK